MTKAARPSCLLRKKKYLVASKRCLFFFASDCRSQYSIFSYSCCYRHRVPLRPATRAAVLVGHGCKRQRAPRCGTPLGLPPPHTSSDHQQRSLRYLYQTTEARFADVEATSDNAAICCLQPPAVVVFSFSFLQALTVVLKVKVKTGGLQRGKVKG